MPDNNFETAFDQGCIMNNATIDNDAFFMAYFNVNGENSWEEIGDDYPEIIGIYYCLIAEIAGILVQQEAFKNLPKKSFYHIGFASFHNEE